jgi:hypothetical protein
LELADGCHPKYPAPTESGREVTQALRILARIAVLALAVTVFAVLTGICARSVSPPGKHRGERAVTFHRPLGARFSALPLFARQCGVFALIALAGRKALRLRL